MTPYISESEDEKQQEISKLKGEFKKSGKINHDKHSSINRNNFERDRERIKDKFESIKYHLSIRRDSEIRKLNTLFMIDSEKYYSKYSHNIRDKQREREGSNHYSIPQ